MERSLAIAVCLVNIGTLLNESLNKPNFKLYYCQVKRTSIDSTTKIDVDSFCVDQHLSSFKLFISDCETEWCAVVLVEDVGVCIAL